MEWWETKGRGSDQSSFCTFPGVQRQRPRIEQCSCIPDSVLTGLAHFYVNTTQGGVIWEGGIVIKKMSPQDWPVGKSCDNWYGWIQSNVGHGTHGQEALGCIRKQAEQVTRSISPSLQPFPDFFPWWIITWKCRMKNPFFPRLLLAIMFWGRNPS